MNTHRTRRQICMAGCLMSFGILMLTNVEAQEFPEISPPPGADGASDVVESDAYEVMTRGPLHEAFARPVDIDPTPGSVVEREPPEPIDEIPPEVVPEGENVIWIPGYWGWDPDQEDFLWVSGVWRDVPPSRDWVPGYWSEAEGGYQWIPGFWTRDGDRQVNYLPTPPESLEQGPTSPAPGDNYFWVPGSWVWRDADYQWRPGLWSRAYDQWVWIPSHYQWTPYGCVYTAGYWDYPIARRGVLFAPIYFRSAIYRRPGYYYSPSYAINVAHTLYHWFVNPYAHHYYYGNYYGGNYVGVSLIPWYSYSFRRGYYDPLLSYYRWSYGRRNIDFTDRLRRWHHYYNDRPDNRPPKSYAAQRDYFRDRSGEDRDSERNRLARPVEELVAQRGETLSRSAQRFERLSNERRRELTEGARESRGLQRQRSQLEGNAREDATAEAEDRGDSRSPQRQEGLARRARQLQLPQTRELRAFPERRRSEGGRLAGQEPSSQQQGRDEQARRRFSQDQARPAQERSPELRQRLEALRQSERNTGRSDAARQSGRSANQRFDLGELQRRQRMELQNRQQNEAEQRQRNEVQQRLRNEALRPQRSDAQNQPRFDIQQRRRSEAQARPRFEIQQRQRSEAQARPRIETQQPRRQPQAQPRSEIQQRQRSQIQARPRVEPRRESPGSARNRPPSRSAAPRINAGSSSQRQSPGRGGAIRQRGGQESRSAAGRSSGGRGRGNNEKKD